MGNFKIGIIIILLTSSMNSGCSPFAGFGSNASTKSSNFNPGLTATLPYTWTFTGSNSSNYALGGNIDINGSNVCELTPANQTDNNDTALGYAGGTTAGILFNTLSDGTSTGLKLGNDGVCNGIATNCSNLNSSWTPQYSTLQGYWSLNGVLGAINNGDTVTATIGPNGTANNAGMSYVSGKLNQGISFNGVNNSIGMGTSIDPSGVSKYSIVAWVNATNGGTNQGIAGWWDGTNGIFIQSMTAGTGLLVFAGAAGGLSFGQATFSTVGVWTHVALVYDGSQPTDITRLKMYVNGQLTTLTMAGGAIPATLGVLANKNFVIGNVNTLARYWNGTIDEVAAFNQALTAAEVQTIYSRQAAAFSGVFTSRIIDSNTAAQPWTSFSWIPTLPFLKALPDSGASESTTSYTSLANSSLMNGIVGLWHLDEASGTSGVNSVIDQSGLGNNATPTNTTFGVSGKINSSASFNGTSSYIGMTNNNLASNSSHTACSWFSTTSTTGEFILNRNGASTSNYTLYVNHVTLGSIGGTLNKLSTMLYFSTSGYTPIVTGTHTVNDGQWHYGCEVYDSVGATLSLYLDGALEAGPTATGGVGNLLENGDATCFGAFSSLGSCGTPFFTGSLDEMAIWNRVLSATEIQQVYQRGASRIKYRVKSCSDSTCTTGSPIFQGPDGTVNTYFSEVFNMSTQAATPSGTVQAALPSMTLQNYSTPVPNNRYFQYQMVLESDSATTTLMPEVKSVSAGPNHYDSSSPAVVSKTGVAYKVFSGVTETLGAGGCSSGVTYNLGVGASYSSATWYYWNGSTWTTTSGTTATSNSAAVINSHASSFAATAGTGQIYFKAFLNSSGSSKCELSSVLINGT